METHNSRPALGDDGWPILERPASLIYKTGSSTFGRGVSSRLLINAAYRQHERAQEERKLSHAELQIQEAKRRALWDILNGKPDHDGTAPTTPDEHGRTLVLVDLLRSALEPLEVSAALIESDDGEQMACLIARIKDALQMYDAQAVITSLRSAPVPWDPQHTTAHGRTVPPPPFPPAPPRSAQKGGA